MLIGLLGEHNFAENRVALVPETIKKLCLEGAEVIFEKSCGINAGFSDDDYKNAGGEMKENAAQIWQKANIIFKVWADFPADFKIPDMTVIIADFSRFAGKLKTMRAFDVAKIPRISRAQAMDVLSSQGNLAGYKAALEALNFVPKAAPMMITAAGAVAPLKVLVWGIGVAGLQGLATAKRMGAKIFGADIIKETSSQAASLGAVFIDENIIASRINEFDIIITAAGRYPMAPILLDEKLYLRLKKNALVLDIAGNVDEKLQSPNILRQYNIVSKIADTASRLLSNNLYNFFHLIYDSQAQNLNFDFNDEIIKSSYIGEKRHV